MSDIIPNSNPFHRTYITEAWAETASSRLREILTLEDIISSFVNTSFQFDEDPDYEADSESGNGWSTDSDASDNYGDSCDAWYIVRRPSQSYSAKIVQQRQ